MGPRVCAIDMGTSSAKLAVVDAGGHILDARTVEYPMQSPHPGWAETNTQDWLASIDAGLAELLGQSPDVVGVGLAGQMHGVVVGDQTRALRPAMLWPDSRALDELERWRGLPPGMLARLANPLAPGMLGPMLAWLARQEPAVLTEATYACSPKDWLRMQLTDTPVVTDASDASATLAWDATRGRWFDELLDAVGIPRALLPDVLPPHAAAPASGRGPLPAGVPVSVGGADTAAALLATQLAPGEALVNLGTGIQVCMATTAPVADHDPRHHTFADAAGGWYTMIAPQNGGLALGRVRALLAADWDELYASLDEQPKPSSVRFAPWFAPDRLPHLRPGGEAGWHGMDLATGRADLLRAALESIAFQVARAIAALPEQPDSLRLSGGGTRDPRMQQLICDVVGLPARRSTTSDATALGAAMLGFRAAGLEPGWPAPRSEEQIMPRRDPALAERHRRFTDEADQQLER